MVIYSGKLSKQYSELRHTYTATDDKVFLLLKEIGILGKKVLDFGCGDGRYTLMLGKMGAQSVTGIDVSPAMIAMAQKQLASQRFENIHFLKADGSELPFQPQSFDLVFSNFVLHHFVDVRQPLAEIGRVLKNRGYFLGTFNTFEVSDPRLFNTEIPLRLGHREPVTVHNLIKSDNEIKADLKKTEFSIISYTEENNLALSISPGYTNKDKIQKIKTIICLAKK